ncbi:esterase family protein [Aspergillus ellipticus CBS 707.79]|uniref:Esterase family protein n=1 Tax=Aspergillus ellipticus CBS 707.79 TaxID=1448320 RepID=A0A319DLV8_9EURO|nr:esterase family protein [Aspergillus ellipticus CBS 707.79]
MDWIKRWAAIGDSYTAGIGAGSLWTDEKDDYECSRYDLSYPAVLKHAIGSTNKKFQYVACSGARTGDIFKQVDKLDDNQDLVILSAGGNDLCLSRIITTCVFFPLQGENKCKDIIKKAQTNIDTILKPNIRQVLEATMAKMSDKGIIVVSLYGQFFDDADDDCTNNQDWSFPRLDPFDSIPLTREHRTQFNKLVANINEAIKQVIHDLSPTDLTTPYIRTADWDEFMRKGLRGQFCLPESTGAYPDPAQPNLAFFRPDTRKSEHRDLKRRELGIPDDIPRLLSSQGDFDDSAVTQLSSNLTTAVMNTLSSRDPAPPDCPGDNDIDLGIGLPDRWGKFFHPNELGHRMIASFVLNAIHSTRAHILNKRSPVCMSAGNEFKCWQKDGRKDYANPDLLNKNYQTYCNEVNRNYPNTNWHDEREFNALTPEAHTFSITLQNGEKKFDKAQCLESFKRIIHGCDGDDSNNPLNWKFGGRYVRDDYVYELNIHNSVRRVWPPMKELAGSCTYDYAGWDDKYDFRGRGWADTDSGQDTIIPAIRDCNIGLKDWNFQYLDEIDDKGNEWKATFKISVDALQKCFNNGRVAAKAGGDMQGGCVQVDTK